MVRSNSCTVASFKVLKHSQQSDPDTSREENNPKNTERISDHQSQKPSPTIGHYNSDAFVLAAGCVLFRAHPQTHQLQVCLVYNAKTKQYLLPKGRKDQGEPMHLTATRETYEETGYPCVLHPCTMPTRAPVPGMNLSPYTVLQSENICEPFAMTVSVLEDDAIKTVWWYLGWLKDNHAEKVDGTHASVNEEAYQSSFHDLPHALRLIHNSITYKEVLERAMDLVQKHQQATS